MKTNSRNHSIYYKTVSYTHLDVYKRQAIPDTLNITQRAADEIVYVRADAPAGGL